MVAIVDWLVRKLRGAEKPGPCELGQPSLDSIVKNAAEKPFVYGAGGVSKETKKGQGASRSSLKAGALGLAASIFFHALVGSFVYYANSFSYGGASGSDKTEKHTPVAPKYDYQPKQASDFEKIIGQVSAFEQRISALDIEGIEKERKSYSEQLISLLHKGTGNDFSYARMILEAEMLNIRSHQLKGTDSVRQYDFPLLLNRLASYVAQAQKDFDVQFAWQIKQLEEKGIKKEDISLDNYAAYTVFRFFQKSPLFTTYDDRYGSVFDVMNTGEYNCHSDFDTALIIMEVVLGTNNVRMGFKKGHSSLLFQASPDTMMHYVQRNIESVDSSDERFAELKKIAHPLSALIARYAMLLGATEEQFPESLKKFIDKRQENPKQYPNNPYVPDMVTYIPTFYNGTDEAVHRDSIKKAVTTEQLLVQRLVEENQKRQGTSSAQEQMFWESYEVDTKRPNGDTYRETKHHAITKEEAIRKIAERLINAKFNYISNRLHGNPGIIPLNIDELFEQAGDNVERLRTANEVLRKARIWSVIDDEVYERNKKRVDETAKHFGKEVRQRMAHYDRLPTQPMIIPNEDTGLIYDLIDFSDDETAVIKLLIEQSSPDGAFRQALYRSTNHAFTDLDWLVEQFRKETVANKLTIANTLKGAEFKTRDETLLHQMVELAKDENVDIYEKRYVIGLLADNGYTDAGKMAFENLKKASQGEEWILVLEYADLLSRIKYRAPLEEVLDMFRGARRKIEADDKDPSIAHPLVTYLAQAGYTEAKSILHNIFENPEEAIDIRQEALEQLIRECGETSFAMGVLKDNNQHFSYKITVIDTFMNKNITLEKGTLIDIVKQNQDPRLTHTALYALADKNIPVPIEILKEVYDATTELMKKGYTEYEFSTLQQLSGELLYIADPDKYYSIMAQMIEGGDVPAQFDAATRKFFAERKEEQGYAAEQVMARLPGYLALPQYESPFSDAYYLLMESGVVDPYPDGKVQTLLLDLK